MALETNNNNEAFLSGGGGEDDFAALDSMGLTGQSQYGMNTVHISRQKNGCEHCQLKGHK